MRILFVGTLWQGATGRHRLAALRDLGHDVVDIDTTPKKGPSILERILGRLGYHLDTVGVNSRILECVRESSIDLVWVDKMLSISRNTLLEIQRNVPGCGVLFYSPDDMMILRNQSRQYLACLPLYDLHVTTKSYNVAELKALGANDVLFIDNAYDPHTHRPIALTAEERAKWGAEVGFVGGFEQERYKLMLYLARSGVPVSVRGPGWKQYSGRHANLDVQPGWLYGDDYARAICATKINLGFLRKVARDLQTTRSIEIPACGGFMLAERTEEHLHLFIEGEEAEFFDGIDELIKKTKHYLARDLERTRIADSGRRRCLTSGYSNHDRIRTILKHIDASSPYRRV